MAALASWLDARAHGGQWLVRIEDVDTPRCVPGADHIILQQLAACGLHPDAPPIYQSQRGHVYQKALDDLIRRELAYPCGCTRQDIVSALAATGQARARNGELVYPGTCRHGLEGRQARSWRFLTANLMPNMPLAQRGRLSNAIYLVASEENPEIRWTDRRLGLQRQTVSREVGDFVLKRADGLWAYQLAVVADDAAQGVTHVVRGEDLADNTARQILLGGALGLPPLTYLHTPLVLGPTGEKLSKQNGARALDLAEPLTLLRGAAAMLGLPCARDAVPDVHRFLDLAVADWRKQEI